MRNKKQNKIELELKALDEMKINLLSNVSHELRTPLVAIKGYTDLILKEKIGPLNGQQKKGLEISLKSIERLITIIENLLNFSKTEMRIEKLKLSTFDLLDVARESIQLIKSNADKKELEIISDFSDITAYLKGDRDKICQVFINLLDNAVKFNDYKGKIHLEINLSGKEWVIVKISDTGIGIPKIAINKIFERFYQVDGSINRKYGGTGIGLSIVKNIIRLHGGKISVSSKEGEGTCFTFALPLLVEENDLYIKTYKKPSFKGLIEVYSENKSRGDKIEGLLSDKQFQILKTSLQSEALYIAEKYNPDLILWDIEKVDHETLDKLDLLKKNEKTYGIPLLIISRVRGIEKKYQIKAEGFISGSLDKESFIFIIEKVLSPPVYKIGNRPSVLIISEKELTDCYLAFSVTQAGMIPICVTKEEKEIINGLSYEPKIIVMDIEEPEKYISKFSGLPIVIICESGKYEKNKSIEHINKPVSLIDFQKKIQTLAKIEHIDKITHEDREEHGKTVLIVDDEPEIVSFLEMVLTAENYEIKKAYSGSEAITILKKEKDIGMVLLDVAMEDIDGIEVCKRIKSNSNTQDIPVYIVTALLDDMIKQRCLDACADGYLAKPFKINDLLDIIGRCIGKVSET